MSTLTASQARRVYDRIGAGQDLQAFYEDRATAEILRNADFESAESVFELGSGTGRFAQKLLTDHLPASASYRGVDLSPKMVALAEQRLCVFGPRAQVLLSDGGPPTGESDASCDRFVSNFVFDLLSDEMIASVIEQAHRLLRPQGLLCVASLTSGSTPVTRAVAGLWSHVHRAKPALVGGCRPIDLLAFIDGARWRIVHHRRLAPLGLPCEAIVASRI